MALPYFLPPTIPFGTGVPPTSAQQINQIYQQHNIHAMAFMQGMQYPPHHVGYNFQPVPFKPYYTAPVNSLNTMNFSHTTVPKIMYPIAPLPLRPIVPAVSSKQNYQYQPRHVAKRVAAVDTETKAEPKRHKPSEVKPSPSNIKRDSFLYEENQPQDLRLIPDDDKLRDTKNPMPLSGSRVNPLFVGQNPSELSRNSDSPYRQQLTMKPGPGQQYITKIRSLVEGITEGHKKLIPSTVKPPKKIRRKSKTNENPIKKKRQNSEITESDLKSVPSSWHPDPDSYANDHLVIGSNGTFISKSFYNTIPWKSFNKSTRILIGHYFNNYTLATQTLDGDCPLNPSIIEDITSHVMEKCNVGRDSVRDIISSICADEAARRRRT